MSNLIYIMGKSSTGKDTINKRLKDKIDANVYVPYTTRPMRDGEQEGREYYFLEKEQLEELQEQGKVMERRDYEVNIDNSGKKDIWTYATIADSQWDKDGDLITIGTLESYVDIKKYLEEHPEKKLNIIPVYITIDEQEIEKRARKREESQKNPNYSEMQRRLNKDKIDFSEEKLREAGIGAKQTFENYNLDECVEKVIRYIEREKEKTLTMQEKYKIKVQPIAIKQEQVNKQEQDREI